LEHTRKHIHWL